MQSKLSDLPSDVCSIEYLSTLNKFRFREKKSDSKVFITSISANDFLGNDNNHKYVITELVLISSSVLNMAGDSIIILEIPNLQTNPRILDNILTGEVIPSSTVAYIVIDVPSYGLLKYGNGNFGDLFSYILMNTDVRYSNLVVKTQSEEVIEVSDYDLRLQYIVHNRNNSTQLAASKNIDKSLSSLVHMLGNLWIKYTKK